MATLRWRMLSHLTRRYPLKSGCAKAALNPVTRMLAGSCDKTLWARGPLGARLRTPSADYVGRVVFFAGDLDPKLTWLCRRLVRPGDTVLDIGANIGLITMVLSKLVGQSGAVHAFEPNPNLLALLDETLPANKASNVTLHRCALGAEPAELTLTVPVGNTGAATLARNVELEHVAYVTTVPVRRLVDELSGVGPIRFVKIDVEGFEARVLQGAEPILADAPPDAILFEANRFEGAARDHPVFQLLSGFGYRFFSIPTTFLSVQPRVMSLEDRVGASGHDVLAASARAYDKVARLVRAKRAAHQ